MKGAARGPPRFALAFVERRVDLRGLLGFAGLETLWPLRRFVVGERRLTAEVEPEHRQVGPVAVRDLLERGEELLLRRRPGVGRDGHLLARADLDRPVLLETGRGRDQLADDDVLLQSEQAVDLALDRGVRKDLRSLL